MANTTDDPGVVNLGKLARRLGTTTRTLRKVIKTNRDFPVLSRGSSGVPYRFDLGKVQDWWAEDNRKLSEGAEARRVQLERWRIEIQDSLSEERS